jgi:release factor glutamine methyltransferase
VTALDAVHDVTRALEGVGVPSPRVDAEHLVAHVLGVSRSELYVDDRELAHATSARLRRLVERRRAREPLAYILGEWGFRRLVLAVDRRVLVPRPETEVVVERSLALIRELPEPAVIDIGTGSGAIALAIADEHPGARVTATDRSEEALAVAGVNAGRTGLRIELVQGDLFAGLRGPFDLVVSNPPYVAAEDAGLLQPEIREYEPAHAFFGAGVAETVAREARAVLRTGGWLVLECGDGQAEGLSAHLRRLGYDDVGATPDLAGLARVVEGRLP